MWLDSKTSMYECHADNVGRPLTYRDILLTRFAIPHRWFHFHGQSWVNGQSNDLDTIIELRQLDRSANNYKIQKGELKNRLQCFTPAALLASKKKDHVIEIERTGVMQLDFDYQDVCEYDIEELKRCVFSLPFIGFCGLSCSGDGFYAMALIAEPDRLSEYAEHCFAILHQGYGITADTSKGKKIENLRYVSYDSNMLIRENPEPLRIKRFQPKPAPIKTVYGNQPMRTYSENDALIRASLNRIKTAQTGQRWQTIQQVAFTLGGLGDPSIIHSIKAEIESNSEFNGEEEKYCKCAEVCFKDGSMKPLQHRT